MTVTTPVGVEDATREAARPGMGGAPGATGADHPGMGGTPVGGASSSGQEQAPAAANPGMGSGAGSSGDSSRSGGEPRRAGSTASDGRVTAAYEKEFARIRRRLDRQAEEEYGRLRARLSESDRRLLDEQLEEMARGRALDSVEEGEEDAVAHDPPDAPSVGQGPVQSAGPGAEGPVLVAPGVVNLRMSDVPGGPEESSCPSSDRTWSSESMNTDEGFPGYIREGERRSARRRAQESGSDVDMSGGDPGGEESDSSRDVGSNGSDGSQDSRRWRVSDGSHDPEGSNSVGGDSVPAGGQRAGEVRLT